MKFTDHLLAFVAAILLGFVVGATVGVTLGTRNATLTLSKPMVVGPLTAPAGVLVHVSSGRLKVICDNGGDATIRPAEFGSIIVDCGTK